MEQLIRSTWDNEIFDMSIFDQPRSLYGFQSRLLSHLHEHPERLGSSCAAGQLLSIAYTDHQHLNFVPYTLTSQSLAMALQSKELRTAKSISLWHSFADHDETTALFVALSNSTSLEQIYCVKKDSVKAGIELHDSSLNTRSECSTWVLESGNIVAIGDTIPIQQTLRMINIEQRKP
jgi:hypothetical protein